MIALFLSPPLLGLFGVGKGFEDALARNRDEDFRCDDVVVGTDLREGRNTECCHDSFSFYTRLLRLSSRPSRKPGFAGHSARGGTALARPSTPSPSTPRRP